MIKKQQDFVLKIFTLLLFAYLFWYKETYGENKMVLYGLIVVFTVLSILFSLKNGGETRISLPFMLKIYISFGLYAFLSGLFVSASLTSFLGSVVRYFVFVVICYDLYLIYSVEDSIEWLLNIFVFCAFVCSFQLLFFGYSYNNGVVVRTLGSLNNPNKLALDFLLGLIGLVFDYRRFNKHILVNSMLVLLFLYSIILTGSRKFFISSIALLVVWLYNYVKRGIVWKNSAKRIGAIALFACVCCGAGFYFIRSFSDFALFQRLSRLGSSNGSDLRRILYVEAIETWLKHPFFGVGYNQFLEYSSSGLYSHSIYAELLSCTGLFGFLLFMLPVLYILYSMIRDLFSDKSKRNYQSAMLLVIVLLELFLGAGQVLIYEMEHLVLLLIVSLLYKTTKSKRGLYEQSIDCLNCGI